MFVCPVVGLDMHYWSSHSAAHRSKRVCRVDPVRHGHQQQQEGCTDDGHQNAPPNELPQGFMVHGTLLLIAAALHSIAVNRLYPYVRHNSRQQNIVQYALQGAA